MIKIRKAGDRGQTKIDWLDGKHTFSFGNYFDEAHMGFGDLRVINDDWIKEGAGFATHGHRDMEIVTYILEGAIEHKDSLGTTSVIYPGEIQRMSAGKGILHSEFNHYKDKKTHLLQIWILPEKKGIEPGYEQKKIGTEKNIISLIASKDGGEGAVSMNQDAKIFRGNFEKNKSEEFKPENKKIYWLHVARGKLKLNDKVLNEGDSAGIEDEKSLKIISENNSEFLIFETKK